MLQLLTLSNSVLLKKQCSIWVGCSAGRDILSAHALRGNTATESHAVMTTAELPSNGKGAD